MSPFNTRLQELSRLADRDPAAAWEAIARLPDEASSTAEIVQVGGLATQVGALLGRPLDAAAFVAALRNHALATGNGEAARSLWRAEGILRYCARQDDGEARAKGIASEADSCRYAGALARTLASCGRGDEALPFLREAAARCAGLAPGDPVVAQTAAIANGFIVYAQQRMAQARELLAAATAMIAVSAGRQTDWRQRHAALFAEVRARLLSGQPGAALRAIPGLMDLEDANQAGPADRFHTAALACRAYHARGDQAQAQRTLEACRDFASRAPEQDLSAHLAQLTADIAP